MLYMCSALRKVNQLTKCSNSCSARDVTITTDMMTGAVQRLDMDSFTLVYLAARACACLPDQNSLVHTELRFSRSEMPHDRCHQCT